MTRTIQKVNIEGTNLNIKAIYNKPTVNIICIVKLNTLPLRSGKKQELSLTPTLFHMVLDALVTAIKKKKKEIKRTPNWKGRSKTVTVCKLNYTQKILKILPENY